MFYISKFLNHEHSKYLLDIICGYCDEIIVDNSFVRISNHLDICLTKLNCIGRIMIRFEHFSKLLKTMRHTKMKMGTFKLWDSRKRMCIIFH